MNADRRSFCKAIAVATLGGVAGCIADASSPSDAPSDSGTDPTTTESRTDSATGDGLSVDYAPDGRWPSFGADRRNSGVRPAVSGPTEGRIEWTAVGDAPTVLCSPVVADGTVYTGSAADAVHALDPQTGEERWRFETTAYVETAPAVVDGTVYAADSEGVVYAIGADGTERWRHDTGHNLHSRAIGVDDGRVFVGTAGTMPNVVSGETDESRRSLLLAIDAETGDPQWRYEAPDWFTGPAITDGGVFVGDHTGRVSALDVSTGEVAWRWRPEVTTEDGDRPGAILAPPTYHDGTVYVGVHELGWLVALSARTGNVQWHTRLRAPNVKSSPAVDGQRVYVGATGTESSDYDAPDEPTPTRTPTPTETDGDRPVQMPTIRPSGSVFALSTGDGAIEWRTEADHDFRSSPAVVDDRVYVGGGDYLYSLSRSSGERQWRVETGDFVYSSPAVAHGRAYLGSADGHLYCVA